MLGATCNNNFVLLFQLFSLPHEIQKPCKTLNIGAGRIVDQELVRIDGVVLVFGPRTPAELDDGVHHLAFEAPVTVGEELARLRGCVVEEGIGLLLTQDLDTKRKVDELVVRADALQFADPACREELGHWLGQGVFGTSWITSKMSQLAVTYLNLSKSTAKKDAELLRSAPVLGVITTASESPAAQVRAGQAFERVWLRATALGMSLHPMNQVLQLPDVKREVRELLPSPDDHPQITFRLGYAKPDRTSTPRRPLEEMVL